MAQASSNSRPTPTNLPESALADSIQWSFIQKGLEHLDDGFSVYDTDLKLVAWNSKFFQLTDFPMEGFAYFGAPFEDFIRYNAHRGEYGTGNVEDIVRERVSEAKKFLPHVMERERPNGMVLEVRGNPIPGGGFVTVYKDITARKTAERALKKANDELELRVHKRTAELRTLNEVLVREVSERRKALVALKESEERIRLIADTVPALIGYVNADMTYTFANRQYEEWFRRSPDRIVGRSVEEVLGPKVYREHMPCIQAALRGERASREFSINIPTSKGGVKEVHVLVSFIPHISENGSIPGYFVLGQDVTDVRTAEYKFRQAQKMEAIGQLTGGLSHDFNNLLTIIVGNLSVLEEENGEDPGLNELVQPALDAARRGADLVKRMLAFARRQPLKPKVTDASRLLYGMQELLTRALGAQIEMRMQVEENLWNIMVDPHQLENAILNLGINSRDAMEGNGMLFIKAENMTLKKDFSDRTTDVEAGEYVVISVKDTGCGMTPDVIERIFEPFFTTKEKSANSGLGLSMVYGFVNQSQGHVLVESTPGAGTTFRLALPRSLEDQNTDQIGKRSPYTLPHGTEHILLAEDDAGVRAFTATTLRRLGYTVTTAGNGHEALKIFQSGQAFDILFSDIEMPGGLNGIELAKTIRQSAPHLPVLFMSGYPDKVMDQEGLWQEELDLIAKPFERIDLASRVRKALDRKK